MSILIKGFPLPNNCGACPLRLAWCRERIYMVNRPERCPLIPVSPHGRLIDADALIARIRRAKELQPELSDLYENEAVEMLLWVGTEPTIIEAEVSE